MPYYPSFNAKRSLLFLNNDGLGKSMGYGQRTKLSVSKETKCASKTLTSYLST